MKIKYLKLVFLIIISIGIIYSIFKYGPPLFTTTHSKVQAQIYYYYQEFFIPNEEKKKDQAVTQKNNQFF